VPLERVYVNIQRYGNMSAATVPVALCEALEEERVATGALLLHARVRRWPELLRPPRALGQPYDPFAIKRRRVAAERASGAADHPRVPGTQDGPSAAAPTAPFA